MSNITMHWLKLLKSSKNIAAHIVIMLIISGCVPAQQFEPTREPSVTATITSTVAVQPGTPTETLIPTSTLMSTLTEEPLCMQEIFTANFSYPVAAFSPNNRYLAIGTGEAVLLLDIPTLSIKWQVDHDFNFPFFSTMTISSDGQMLAAGGVRYVRLWNLETGTFIKDLVVPERHDPWTLVFSPDSSLIAAETNVGFLVWDATSGDLLHERDLDQDQRIAFEDNSMLVTSPPFRRFNVVTGEWGEWTDYHFPSFVIEISPDFSTILGTGLAGDVVVHEVYTATTGELLFQMNQQIIGTRIESYSANGSFIAIGANEYIQSWDISTGTLLCQLDKADYDGWDDYIMDLDISSDGKLLAFGLRGEKIILMSLGN